MTRTDPATPADEAALAAGMPSAGRFRSLFLVAEAFLAFAGAGIAATIWQADRMHEDLPCSANGGCAIVAASAWSHLDLVVFHQVPVALLGLIGYVALLSLAMLRFGTDSPRLDGRLHGLLGLISAGGFFYSWYLQWVAHAEIGAFCVWCRASALVMTLLFFVTLGEWRAGRRPRPRRQDTYG